LNTYIIRYTLEIRAFGASPSTDTFDKIRGVKAASVAEAKEKLKQHYKNKTIPYEVTYVVTVQDTTLVI
jgi:hypothetical protein